MGGEFSRLFEEFLRAIFLYSVLLHVDVEPGAALEGNLALEPRGFVALGVACRDAVETWSVGSEFEELG